MEPKIISRSINKLKYPLENKQTLHNFDSVVKTSNNKFPPFTESCSKLDLCVSETGKELQLDSSSNMSNRNMEFHGQDNEKSDKKLELINYIWAESTIVEEQGILVPNNDNNENSQASCVCPELLGSLNNALYNKHCLKHVIERYKYKDLIVRSNRIYSNMKVCAVGISLETIKKIDELLWGEIGKMYEKLKEDGEVTYTELCELVKKVIVQVHGSNKMVNVLNEYDINLKNATLQIGKYLLSTYHEAYEIVTQADFDIDNPPQDTFHKLKLFCDHNNVAKLNSITSKQRFIKGKNNNYSNERSVERKFSIKDITSLTRWKCSACNVSKNTSNNSKPLINTRKSIPDVQKRNTYMNKNKSTIQTKNVNLPKFSNNRATSNVNTKNKYNKVLQKSHTTLFNNSTNTDPLDYEFDEMNKKMIIGTESNHSFDEDDDIVDYNDEDDDHDNNNIIIMGIKHDDIENKISKTLFCTQVNRDHSKEILSILAKNKTNQKKARSNLTISTVNEDNNLERGDGNKTTTLFREYSSSFLITLRRCKRYIPNAVLTIAPNLFAIILLSLHKNNLLDCSKLFCDVTYWLKNRVRDFLIGALSLLDN